MNEAMLEHYMYVYSQIDAYGEKGNYAYPFTRLLQLKSEKSIKSTFAMLINKVYVFILISKAFTIFIYSNQ